MGQWFEFVELIDFQRVFLELIALFMANQKLGWIRLFCFWSGKRLLGMEFSTLPVVWVDAVLLC